MIRDTEARNSACMRCRSVALVRGPPVSRVIEPLHQMITCNFRKNGRGGHNRAGSIGLHLHVHRKFTPERILGAIDCSEEVTRRGKPIVGAIQENTAGDKAPLGYFRKRTASGEAQSRDDAPLIDLLRGRIADG